MTQEDLNLRAAERSRRVTARTAEALRDQWLITPNRTHVIKEGKK